MGFGNYPPGVTDLDIERAYSDELPDYAKCGNCALREVCGGMCALHGLVTDEDNEACMYWEEQ